MNAVIFPSQELKYVTSLILENVFISHRRIFTILLSSLRKCDSLKNDMNMTNLHPIKFDLMFQRKTIKIRNFTTPTTIINEQL